MFEGSTSIDDMRCSKGILWNQESFIEASFQGRTFQQVPFPTAGDSVPKMAYTGACVCCAENKHAPNHEEGTIQRINP